MASRADMRRRASKERKDASRVIPEGKDEEEEQEQYEDEDEKEEQYEDQYEDEDDAEDGPPSGSSLGALATRDSGE